MGAERDNFGLFTLTIAWHWASFVSADIRIPEAEAKRSE